MSLINMLKSKGPKTEPCGTPEGKTKGEERVIIISHLFILLLDKNQTGFKLQPSSKSNSTKKRMPYTNNARDKKTLKRHKETVRCVA
jgi:hypothetical protein